MSCYKNFKKSTYNSKGPMCKFLGPKTKCKVLKGMDKNYKIKFKYGSQICILDTLPTS